jgi:hypothetical protein
LSFNAYPWFQTNYLTRTPLDTSRQAISMETGSNECRLDASGKSGAS